MRAQSSGDYMQLNVKRKPRDAYKILTLAGTFLLLSLPLIGQQPDPLTSGFETPPASAAPRVWFHWLDGQISKEGLQLDIDWMHRIGIGGFQTFQGAFNTPPVVHTPLRFMTPGWKDAFQYATDLGNKFNLEMSIAASPGWSETGGPWVVPQDAMKKLVWSSIEVEPGRAPILLPHPPTVSGPIGDVPIVGNFGASTTKAVYYQDVAVLAFPEPAAAQADRIHPPVITSSGGTISGADLTGGSVQLLPNPEHGDASWIQFAYDQPHTVQSLTLLLRDPVNPLANFLGIPEHTGQYLEASDDGVDFHRVLELPNSLFPERTIDFAPVTAKFFRRGAEGRSSTGRRATTASNSEQGTSDREIIVVACSAHQSVRRESWIRYIS
jgi:hypothetical protein